MEDNDGDVRLFKEALKEDTIDVHLHVASSGQEALDLVRRNSGHEVTPAPDGVLLDWILPNTDGGDVLRSLKNRYPDVPVIVMSGSESQKDVLKEAECPADDCVSKPCTPAEFSSLLHRCVELSQRYSPTSS